MALRHEAVITTPPASASPACPPRNEGEQASFESMANTYMEEVGVGDYVGVEDLTSQDAPGSEGNTCDDGADLVVLSNEEAARAKKTMPAQRKPRCSEKWNDRVDLILMTVAQKRACWIVPGSGVSVKDKWEAACADLQNEPHVRWFGNKSKSAIKSRFDYLLRLVAERNSEANIASGCGNAPGDELDSKSDKYQMEKIANEVLDAKAGIKADKREERLKKASSNAIGRAALDLGKRRCGPGWGATSFGEAHDNDRRALVDLGAEESDLTRLMEMAIQQSSNQAELMVQREDARERREEKRRRDQFEQELVLRREERAAERAKEIDKEEKRYDREREERKAERKLERKHELEMMKMQLQIAMAKK